ncbi:MAG: hypothetical protein FWE06_05590 [Oscillospiraceae bacterium]|nr:hypothetical protein [Oscillospiraceae bacterium]
MKKFTFAPMIIAVLLLFPACNVGGEAVPRLHEFYGSMRYATMDARVRADFGDRVVEYLLRYNLSLEEESVEVLEPSELAGIRVVLHEGGSILQFDGLSLETGALPGTGLSPLEAVPFAVQTWREGHIVAYGTENAFGTQAIRAVYASTHGGIEHRMVVWFDVETMHPLRSETYVDGANILTITFLQVELG